ncbi:hypothetical protein AB7849_05020 [Rhodanobacter sp. 115]|uniref:hypothetical protein n=1 Tax=Rhodanobacter sp. FW021-MT20 TaxID=1162282 RepID=UPI000260CE82|nr:hypothetical protein [Rhodanobacter sp. 115]EIL88671.1 hypothetical protein UU5_16909 [Rhodanobacter sp. 115]
MIATTLGTDRQPAHPLRLAVLATDEVRQHLREYADATHRPAWEAMHAANLLDTVADLLDKAVAR